PAGLAHWRRPSDYTYRNHLSHKHRSPRIPEWRFSLCFLSHSGSFPSVLWLLFPVPGSEKSPFRFLPDIPALPQQTYWRGSDTHKYRHRRLDENLTRSALYRILPKRLFLLWTGYHCKNCFL